MTRQPNRYRGRCFRCGAWVQPETGYLVEPTVEMLAMWPGYPPMANLRKHLLVEHKHCANRYDGTAVHYHYNPERKEE